VFLSETSYFPGDPTDIGGIGLLSP